MIPLAETDPDPGLPQLNETFHHRPEFWINAASLFEPEVKEITRDDEKVDHNGIRITRMAGFNAPSPETCEQLHAFLISGIGTALEV